MYKRFCTYLNSVLFLVLVYHAVAKETVWAKFLVFFWRHLASKDNSDFEVVFSVAAEENLCDVTQTEVRLRDSSSLACFTKGYFTSDVTMCDISKSMSSVHFITVSTTHLMTSVNMAPLLDTGATHRIHWASLIYSSALTRHLCGHDATYDNHSQHKQLYIIKYNNTSV